MDNNSSIPPVSPNPSSNDDSNDRSQEGSSSARKFNLNARWVFSTLTWLKDKFKKIASFLFSRNLNSFWQFFYVRHRIGAVLTRTVLAVLLAWGTSWFIVSTLNHWMYTNLKYIHENDEDSPFSQMKEEPITPQTSNTPCKEWTVDTFSYKTESGSEKNNQKDYYVFHTTDKHGEKEYDKSQLCEKPSPKRNIYNPKVQIIDYKPEELPSQKKDDKNNSNIYVFRRYVAGDVLGVEDIKDLPKGCNHVNTVRYAQYAFARKNGQDDRYTCLFVVRVSEVYHEKDVPFSDIGYGIHLELLINNDPEWIKRGTPKDSEMYYAPIYQFKENHYAKKPEDDGIKVLDWYTFKGMAESSEILKINVDKKYCYSLEQPTSTASLVSWIKNNWLTQTKYMFPENIKSSVKLTQEQLDKIICPELERILQKDFGKVSKATGVIFTRIINGSIQFTTRWFFWIGMYLMFFFFLDRLKEKATLAKAYLCGFNLSDVSTIPKSREDLRKQINGRSASETVDVLWSVMNVGNVDKYQYDATIGRFKLFGIARSNRRNKFDYKEMMTFVAMLLDAQEKKFENKWFLWQFFIGSLSGLGFLGTVWGIGEALMGTSSVLSDELTKQQSGVSEVALALGTAFDTTMVALSLSLLAGLVSAYFMFKEKNFLYALEAFISEELMPSLKNKESEPHTKKSSSDVTSLTENSSDHAEVSPDSEQNLTNTEEDTNNDYLVSQAFINEQKKWEEIHHLFKFYYRTLIILAIVGIVIVSVMAIPK